jgi:thiamine-monophosphate kinase
VTGPPPAGGSDETLARDEDSLTACFRELAGTLGPGIAIGIGDDASILPATPGRDLVWTVDVLEEEVDFRRAWLTLEEVGGRAVAAALSDLAAMSARPWAVLLALGSAAADPAPELLELFRGAAAAAARFGASVAGGDLTRRAAGVGVAVTAVGTLPAGTALTRSGALPGDELWVTGEPGHAARGLALLEQLGRAAAEARDPAAVAAWVAPVPRLAEAEWLRERTSPHAAIDLSDGLARDLARLCAASRVGARVEAAALEAKDDADLRRALTGGEDFELLLSMHPGALRGVAADFTRDFGLALRRVGEVTAADGIVLRGGDGSERALDPEGWDHVRRPGPSAA